MDNPILNAALEYAAKGWSVIPISRTKEPLIKWKDASREYLTNPENIKEWWNKFPAANVAIVTGSRSGGLVVIDLDIDDEKGVNGIESLEKWCDDNYIFEIDSDASVYTGRGGRHLYFQSDFEYHNQVGCLEGVDIRGEGGCIIAPPSIHGVTRRQYAWDTDQEEIVVPMADSDVELFLGTMEAKSNQKNEFVKNDFTQITSEGGRNNKLFKYVSRLQSDGESDQDIIEYAKIYNETHLKPPLSDDEVKRTVESVLSHGEWKGKPKNNFNADSKDNTSTKSTMRDLQKASELLKKDIPAPRVFVGVDDELPILVEGTCILSSKPKLGKSWFALSLCMAVARGESFLGYKTQKCSTLYLDLETGEPIQQNRLKKALAGTQVPDNFYIDSAAPTLGKGFFEQVEHYLQQDPNIGIIVIDVFQIIRSAAKSFKETEYEHAYRDLTPLNDLSQRYHISIILVCHDRKAVDPEDPFANILGSTGLQGAATQMIVMFKRGNNPIHISIKGKTIDGLPELDVKLENAHWNVIEGSNSADRETAKRLEEFQNSDIRAAVLDLAEKSQKWKNPYWEGRCSAFIQDAIGNGIAITETPKRVGGFLHQFQGMFLKMDGVQVTILDKGSASKLYRIQKYTISTISTISKNEDLPFQNIEECDKYKDYEIPFS